MRDPGGVLVLETAVCELDIEGRVRRWGAAAQRVFGFEADAAVGEVLPMVPFDLRPELCERLREAADGTALEERTTVWCRADGSPLEVAVSLIQLSNNGHGPSVALVVRDISE